MNILIRPETSADHDAIRHVNRLAFGQGDEARLVDAVRDGGVRDGDKVVAHVGPPPQRGGATCQPFTPPKAAKQTFLCRSNRRRISSTVDFISSSNCSL